MKLLERIVRSKYTIYNKLVEADQTIRNADEILELLQGGTSIQDQTTVSDLPKSPALQDLLKYFAPFRISQGTVAELRRTVEFLKDSHKETLALHPQSHDMQKVIEIHTNLFILKEKISSYYKTHEIYSVSNFKGYLECHSADGGFAQAIVGFDSLPQCLFLERTVIGAGITEEG